MFLSHLPINVPNYIMGRSGIQFSSLTPALSGHNFSINMPNQFRSAPPLPRHQQPLASIKLWNFSSSIFQFVPMFLLTCKSPLFCTFLAILLTSSSVPILPSTKSIISDWRWRGRALSGQHRSCGDLESGERRETGVMPAAGVNTIPCWSDPGTENAGTSSQVPDRPRPANKVSPQPACLKLSRGEALRPWCC